MNQFLASEEEIQSPSVLENFCYVEAEHSVCTQLANMCAYFARRWLQNPNGSHFYYEALQEGMVVPDELESQIETHPVHYSAQMPSTRHKFLVLSKAERPRAQADLVLAIVHPGTDYRILAKYTPADAESTALGVG